VSQCLGGRRDLCPMNICHQCMNEAFRKSIFVHSWHEKLCDHWEPFAFTFNESQREQKIRADHKKSVSSVFHF
jgi:hypothetical protein